MLPRFNAPIITRVSKCDKVDNMANFRSISCCTMFYKCVTKILTNRMKPFLSSQITRSQNAFVRRRSILDNFDGLGVNGRLW